MRVLLAVDGSECSEAAVTAVAERSWPQGTEIEILSATDVPFVPIPDGILPDHYYAKLDRMAWETAKKVVNEAQDRLQKSQSVQLAIITRLKVGAARAVILDEAREWGADLIVLGSHGYTGWQRFLLGSVSYAVAAQAPCSVDIVRQCGMKTTMGSEERR